jgi:hypothetical protein
MIFVLHFEMCEFVTPFIGPVIAKICGPGLTRLHSSKRTAARQRMIWDGQTRVGRAIDINSFD